jgi:HTH-type transcriptional regulator, sugar sensing transcriptional regulator
MALTQELLTLGLSNKEADVYLSALQLGYASVQDISKKASINRTTAYTHIKNLISRGLISVVERYGKLCYIAEKPMKLRAIHEQQEKEVKRRRDVLEDIMPELESLYNLAKEKPTVKYYEHTPENIKLMRKEVSDLRAKEMYNIFNYERYHQYINKKHVQSILDNVENFKVIYISNTGIIDPISRRLQENRNFKLRCLSSEKFGILCEILIAKDRVYIARDNDSLIIRDKLFSQTLTLLFSALWGLAEKA